MHANWSTFLFVRLFSGNDPPEDCVVEENGQWVCVECGKKYAKKFTARRHYRYIHMDNKPVACDVCHKVFKNDGHLYDHRNHTHGLKRPWPKNAGKKNLKNVDNDLDVDPFLDDPSNEI